MFEIFKIRCCSFVLSLYPKGPWEEFICLSLDLVGCTCLLRGHSRGKTRAKAVPARSVSPVWSRHIANRSLHNSQLPWWTIAQITSGRGGRRPLSHNRAFLFPRSSSRVVLYLRDWSNAFKELHNNAVAPKEHTRSSPWIGSEEPKEPRIQILWDLHSLTKGVEAKSHILLFPYIALADPHEMSTKILTLSNHKT